MSDASSPQGDSHPPEATPASAPSTQQRGSETQLNANAKSFMPSATNALQPAPQPNVKIGTVSSAPQTARHHPEKSGAAEKKLPPPAAANTGAPQRQGQGQPPPPPPPPSHPTMPMMFDPRSFPAAGMPPAMPPPGGSMPPAAAGGGLPGFFMPPGFVAPEQGGNFMPPPGNPGMMGMPQQIPGMGMVLYPMQSQPGMAPMHNMLHMQPSKPMQQQQQQQQMPPPPPPHPSLQPPSMQPPPMQPSSMPPPWMQLQGAIPFPLNNSLPQQQQKQPQQKQQPQLQQMPPPQQRPPSVPPTNMMPFPMPPPPPPPPGPVMGGQGAHTGMRNGNVMTPQTVPGAFCPPPMMMPVAMQKPPPPMSMTTAPPVMSPSVAATAKVSVGNATLVALNSKEPPKFSCVLLSGIPAVGKTTIGRSLVNSLKTDGMGWAFFSGGDFLADSQVKRSVWDTTTDVFDALSFRLDELLAQQREHRNIKGLVIDKNCKGIEDIYYLSALLHSKQIPFVGIVGMECDNDDILVQRMGGDDYLKEKLKFHRVIHSRIVGLAKSAGMYRYVDASKSKNEVVQTLRVMVLGCCAQPPSRSITSTLYSDSRSNVLVDVYKDYGAVMNHLFNCVNSRSYQFPSPTDFATFSTKDMSGKGRTSVLRSRYGVRRRVDGQRFLLVLHDKKLFLVPPHMRAVLSMPSSAWVGESLDKLGATSFVLEGDLTYLSTDRQKEVFLVYDAIYWSEAEHPSTNTMIRMTFAERQAFLASNLCSEEAAFSSGKDCVVAHHSTQKISYAVELLDKSLHPSDGLVFQPFTSIHRSDHVLVWQPPSSMIVDFRVGPLLKMVKATDPSLTSPMSPSMGITDNLMGSMNASTRRSSNGTDASDGVLRTFALEVYDKTDKKYVQYEEATVDIRNANVVEGCIIACSLVDGPPQQWLFRRVCYDVLRPIYKHDLEDLLQVSLIPRAKLVSWLMSEQLVPSEVLPNGVAVAIPHAPPPAYETAATTTATGLSSTAANSAAEVADQTAPSVYPSATALLSRATTTATPAAATKTASATPHSATSPTPALSSEAQLRKLASIVPSMHVVEASDVEAQMIAATTHQHTAASNGAKTCAQCRKRRQPEDVRMDRRDKKHYCYSCWLKSGYAFCGSCGEFKAVLREQRGRYRGSMLCTACSKSIASMGDASVGTNHTDPATDGKSPQFHQPANFTSDGSVDGAVRAEAKSKKKSAKKAAAVAGVGPTNAEGDAAEGKVDCANDVLAATAVVAEMPADAKAEVEEVKKKKRSKKGKSQELPISGECNEDGVAIHETAATPAQAPPPIERKKSNAETGHKSICEGEKTKVDEEAASEKATLVSRVPQSKTPTTAPIAATSIAVNTSAAEPVVEASAVERTTEVAATPDDFATPQKQEPEEKRSGGCRAQ